MKYKISKQFARDVENPVAEFSDYDDACFFIERKIMSDNEKGLILIYRLFEEYKVLQEFNKEKINGRINAAQYAEGDRDFPRSIEPIKVCKDDPNAPAHARFIDLKDAELFIEDKLTQTTAITTYYIFDNDILTAELNQRIKKQAAPAGEGSQGKGNVSSFKPTPFNTAPRPQGSPPAWFKDENDDNEKE